MANVYEEVMQESICSMSRVDHMHGYLTRGPRFFYKKHCHSMNSFTLGYADVTRSNH